MESLEGTSDVLYENLLLNVHDEPRTSPIIFTPHNWLEAAKIYNQRMKQVPSDWVIENADVVVVLFSTKGADRNGVIEKFQETYEQAKFANLPFEVINIPLDDSAREAAESFKNQANWFTLLFNDPLTHVLKYMYGITCVPYIYVIRPTCEVISNNGIADLDAYGKNAIVSWMSVIPDKVRKFTDERNYYGGVWRYLGAEMHRDVKKFLVDDVGNVVETANEAQEVTSNLMDGTQSVTEDVSYDINRELSGSIPRIVSQTSQNSEDKLKEELKNLHYTC